mmetsp:Transcript_31411/g.27754  ORF Transcript_31411/g.27754 Transcript_31411/m.27754 type:complete len:289 (+) Transcript_31411:768-1634(+)
MNDKVELKPKSIGGYVDDNTIAIFCSAPDGYFGIFDPVKEIAKFCYDNGIACHVDCNHSAFLLNFDDVHFTDSFEATFETEGITSIGCSLNKFGQGFSGVAVILYKTRILRKSQYYCFFNWNGGMYASPNLAGSRYSSAVAASWTKMLAIGKSGYISKANKVITATTRLRLDLSKQENIDIVTPSTLSILAFKLRQGDSYDLADYLRSKDFNVVNTINPASISYTVTEANAKASTKLADGIKEYIALYLNKSQLYEKEGTKKFYQNQASMKTFVETKHDLPYLMKKNE